MATVLFILDMICAWDYAITMAMAEKELMKEKVAQIDVEERLGKLKDRLKEEEESTAANLFKASDQSGRDSKKGL